MTILEESGNPAAPNPAVQPAQSAIVQLQTRKPARSLWGDAFYRLLHNRAAILGAVIIVLNIIIAIFAPTFAPKAFDDAILADNNAAPKWITQIFPTMRPKSEGGYITVSEAYALGADKLGRDLLSRLIYGARISLAVAVIGPSFSIIIGLTVGLIAGYTGGQVDNLLMRFVDVMYAFPTLLLIILLLAVFRTSFHDQEPGTLAYTLDQLDASIGGLLFVFIGIGITAWMGMARLVRGQVLSVRELAYVEAARAIGARSSTIIIRHILPNIIGPLIVAETLAIPSYISYEAFLSFIGLGVRPPTPSWGSMISEGAQAIQTYPNQTIFPALALFLIMFAFNFLGDGLRDALDPTMRGVD
ncbi:MAG TPA: ABC transporter permease [Phototrophicaceae bacterium]|jgi:oligopeptide transport system permease protein|nr:ABC transporter permease [Phototrophicaceae bacterium]